MRRHILAVLVIVEAFAGSRAPRHSSLRRGGGGGGKSEGKPPVAGARFVSGYSACLLQSARLCRRLHEIFEEAVKVFKLLSELCRVLALQVYLPLKLAGALDLKIELLAHLAELVVNDSQDVRA